MNRHYCKLLFVLPFIMNACMSSMSKRETQELSSKHIYSFTIQDINGNSIEGVKVSYQLKNKEEIVKDTSIITSKTGIVSDFVYATASGSFYRYKSELIYEIKKSGYFTQRGSFNSDNFPNTAETKEQKNGLIILIKPVDYIKDSFILSSKGEELKIKILGFIDVLLLRSLLSDSYLETQSINLIDFKENKYLTFKFVNTNSYNSLRQNKYDIGKTLFDEVIRKILNPLNENLGKSKEFYGYDLTVVGHTKSFADKYAIDQKVLYRYMIPREIVEQYKNKDISGQQVIDASIILMDDERIDLKLQ